MAAAGDVLLPSRADMDEDDYDLVLKLMLEDARQISSGSNGKGKQQEGKVPDTEVAFGLYAQELQNALTNSADRRFTVSMQRALRTDANAVNQLLQQERMARHDHAVAIALSEGRDPPPMPAPAPAPAPAPGTAPQKTSDQTGGAKSPGKGKEAELAPAQSAKRTRTKGFDFRDETDDDLIFQGKRARPGESSSWAASRQPPPDERPCTSCMEPTPEARLIHAPCSHEYCHDCVKSLFTSAMRDETLFPPKCCRQAIPAEQHSQILGNNLVNLYHAKQIEFSTENRTYCHNAECGAFIKPSDVGHCSSCDKRTCVSCKRIAHDGDCPQDTELHRVLELAEQEGWRRCTKCNAMVELALGCNHMTCRCNYQFCYICGVEWREPKACPCPTWNEENLIERAAEINQRRQAPPVANRPRAHAQGQQPHVRAAQDALRDRLLEVEEIIRMNHECDHDGEWRRVRGEELQCEVCSYNLPYYLYECTQCQVLACRKCRFNRM